MRVHFHTVRMTHNSGENCQISQKYKFITSFKNISGTKAENPFPQKYTIIICNQSNLAKNYS